MGYTEKDGDASRMLISLPLGPITTAVLFLKEADLAQLRVTNSFMAASTLDSTEFWRERCCDCFGGHVRSIQVKYSTIKYLGFLVVRVGGFDESLSRSELTEACCLWRSL